MLSAFSSVSELSKQEKKWDTLKLENDEGQKEFQFTSRTGPYLLVFESHEG